MKQLNYQGLSKTFKAANLSYSKKYYNPDKSKEKSIEQKAGEYRIKKEIKKAIQETLVIDNKKSIDIAVNKILKVIENYKGYLK